MPYGAPDPTDPNVLVGVALPADLEATRNMAWVFAEEFARMGLGARRILGLFRSPFYAGAHAAFRRLGEAEVVAIVDECVAVLGPHGAAPRPGSCEPSGGRAEAGTSAARRAVRRPEETSA